MNDNKNMKYAKTLAEMLKIETISDWNQKDKSKYYVFQEKLRELFPNVFTKCQVEDFDGSLLIKWKGKSEEKPVLFMNHQDVVEASGEWKYPPFGGIIAEGKVWGRGAIDTKCGLFGMLQAAEELIDQGFVPMHDIYFESSCNEETDGVGAKAIAKELERRKIKFEFIIDECGMILYDPIGGADGTFGMIGLGEKAYADIRFIAKSSGGHASAPPKDTPLARLGKFITEIENKNIFEVKLSPAVKGMLKTLAPSMKGVSKFILKHPSLFGPIIKKVISNKSPKGKAMMQTTVAFTMANGSSFTNVLPQEAYVIANLRFSHHEGIDNSLDKINNIAKKYDLIMQVDDRGIESRLSSPDSNAFKLISETIREVFPDVIPSPYVSIAASDCRFFTNLSDNCFRFVPFRLSDEQLGSMHGLNENIDVDCLGPGVEFYKRLMKKDFAG